MGRRRSSHHRDKSDSMTVTIYQNGDPSDPGSDVTFKPRRYKSDFDALLDYINKKCSVFGQRTGYTRLFTRRGHIVIDASDFDDGGEYVASTGTYFIKVDYGSRALNLGGRTRKSHHRSKREDSYEDYYDNSRKSRSKSKRRSKSERPDSTRYSYYNRERRHRSYSDHSRDRSDSRDRHSRRKSKSRRRSR